MKTTTNCLIRVGKQLSALLPLLILQLIPLLGTAQSNPAAQALPHTQNFAAFTGSTTVYPAGYQGWSLGTALATTYSTSAFTGDVVLAAGTNATFAAGVYDMNGKIGFLSTGSNQRAICLAINTTGITNTILVSYTGAAQRLENTRQNAIGLQYRIGTTGAFTNVSGSEYLSPALPSVTSISGTSSTSPQTLLFALPAAVQNQAVVQLRWIIRDNAGSGNRPSFSVDDIVVTQRTIVCSPLTLTGFSTPQGTPSASQSFTVTANNITAGAGAITINAPANYQLSIDNVSFSGSITLPNTGGTVYARLSGTTSGVFNNLPVTITSATTTNILTQPVVLSGTVISPTPNITVSGTSIGPVYTPVGTASSNLSYTVQGTNLTNNLLITPPTGVEISSTGGAPWTSAPSSLNLGSGNTGVITITARFSATASAGNTGGNILNASTGATDANVGFSGLVFGGAPALVNELHNATAEWYELLVTQNNLDMRGYTIFDYGGSGGAQPTNTLTFTNNPLWNNIPAGSFIVILQPNNSQTEDVVFTDNGVVIVSACNTTYITQLNGVCTSNGFAMNAQNDGATLRNSSSQNVHSLLYRRSADPAWAPFVVPPSAEYTMAPAPSLANPESVVLSNINSAAAGASNTNTNRTTTITQGRSNDATEKTWVCGTLRGTTVPATQASTVSTGTILEDQIEVNWTNGSGTQRVVVARLAATPRVVPVDGIRYTTTSFGVGTIGTDMTGAGNYVVASGAVSSPLNITGLSSVTNYSFDIYETNGIGECIVYNTSIGTNTLNATTPTGTSITFNTLTGTPFCVSPTSLSASTNVNFTTTGTFGTGNDFTVQISSSLAFTTPVNIGTGLTSPVAATIPAGFSSGTYYVRVVSSNPVRNSTISASFLVNNAPLNVSGLISLAGNSQATINWTNPTLGCFDEIMVVARTGAFTAAVPTGDGTAYPYSSNSFIDPANGTFDGGKVVYKGTTPGQIITDLTNATAYTFKIYTRVGNDWSAGVTSTVTPIFTVSVGDIQFVGVNSSDPDGFAWVTWANIPAGSVIRFTDNGFLSSASANAANNFRGGEETVSWTATSALTPGTVVRIFNNSGTANASTGTVTGNLTGISNSGDQIFAYTGPVQPNTNPSTFTGNIIAAVNLVNAGWLTTGLASTNRSYLPSELNAPNGNIDLGAVNPTIPNWQYNASRSNQTTFPPYRALVQNISNWASNGVPYNPLSNTPFTLSSGLPDVNLTISATSGTEAASTAIIITATVTGTIATPQTVNVVVSGTGITAGDYSLGSATITINAGTNTSGTTILTIQNDVVAEGIETAVISIASPSAGIELGTFDSRNLNIIDNDVPNLKITEINFDGAGSPDGEWIEILNFGATPISINNLTQITNTNTAFTYTFSGTTVINPGQYFTVQLSNGISGFTPTFPAPPASIYATGANNLSNSTSTLTLLFNALTVDQITYSVFAPWPTTASGTGRTLSLNNPGDDNNIGSNWGACVVEGTPNGANVNCNSTIFYSVSSGNLTSNIWSTTPNGTPVFATFTPGTDLVIQAGHTVVANQSSAIDVRTLTINGGGRIWRNSSLTSNMSYFNLYGDFVCNGVIGNGATFDAVGLNIEGTSSTISGIGAINLGRIRKESTVNATSALTINSNVNLYFPGTALFNNTIGNSNFNLTIATGRVVNVNGWGGINGDVSFDGISGTNPGNCGGTWTINGTLNVTGKTFLVTNNTNSSFPFTLNLGANGTITSTLIDYSFASPSFGPNLSVTVGGRIVTTGVLTVLSGTLPANGNFFFTNGAHLMHGLGTPGVLDASSAVSGNIQFNRQGDVSVGVYNFWSTPTAGSTLQTIVQSGSQFGSALNTFEYNPTNATGTDVAGLRQGWVLRPSTHTMQIGKGYITTAAGGVKFNGNPNQGSINIPLANGTFTRFNLIGNPYPSSVDAGLFLAANSTTNIEPALYFWDDDGSLGADYAAGDYAVTNAAGTVATGGSGNAGAFNGQIASGQGFFVEARAAATQVTFTNSMRTTTAATFFEQQQELKRMWINVRNEVGQYNETLLAFIPGASDARDEMYDAKKLPGNENISLFTTIGEEAFAIQAWDDLTQDRIIPLGLNANRAGVHTIALKEIQNMDPTVLVYLEDLQTGAFHNLRLSSYNFILEGELNGANRFRLHFKAPVLVEANAETCTGNDGSIELSANEGMWTYEVRTAENMLVNQGMVNNETDIQNLADGTYLVKLTSFDGYTATFTSTVNASPALSAAILAPSLANAMQNMIFEAIAPADVQVIWNFGDGHTASGLMVDHTYEQPGIYVVSITATNGTCESTSNHEISVLDESTGIFDNETSSVNMLPNPANDFFTLTTNKEFSGLIQITDLSGKVVLTMNLNREQSVRVSTEHLTNGVYFVSIRNANGNSLHKLIVNH